MRKKILATTLALAAAFIMTTSISSLAANNSTEKAEIKEVTEEVALKIALEQGEYTKEEAEEVVIEKAVEDNKPVYKIEFYVGVSRFDYVIEIATGEILDYEIDD